jgi:hypothetical protein
MTVFSVLVPTDGGISTCDGVEHVGKLWLVPQWYDYPKEQASKPARMIRFDNLPFEKLSTGFVHDYMLVSPIPKSVLDGGTDAGYETLSGTQITFGIRRAKPAH